MDGPHQVLYGSFEFEGGDGFGDELGGLRADNVDTEYLSVLGVGDDLYEAVVRVDDGGLGVANEGELTDLDGVSQLLGLSFGKADAADLWLRVGASRDAVALDGPGILAGDLGSGDQSGHGAGMGELRHAGDDVSDGIDARLIGLHIFVDLDKAAVGCDLRLFKTDAFGAGSAPHGDQHLLSFLGGLLAVGAGEGDLDTVLGV